MADPKILVVDDEASILQLFSKIFSHAGYAVFTAKGGGKALEIIEKEDIQIMFLDLNMPDMNGLDLCREIKKRMPMSVIYAMTGYASLFDLADCREAGFDDYFKKPVNLELLKDAAKQGVDKLSRWKKL